jgi:hypothetical protein
MIDRVQHVQQPQVDDLHVEQHGNLARCEDLEKRMPSTTLLDDVQVDLEDTILAERRLEQERNRQFLQILCAPKRTESASRRIGIRNA